jgi:hypothetical protein
MNWPTATHEFIAPHATEFSVFDEASVFGDEIFVQCVTENRAIDVVVLDPLSAVLGPSLPTPTQNFVVGHVTPLVIRGDCAIGLQLP